MKTQFRNTLQASANMDVNMIGVVWPTPSVVNLNARNMKMPGAPNEMTST